MSRDVPRQIAHERDAFAAIVERYQPIVYRWIMGMVSDRDDAEDIMQEVFVIVYQKFGTFRGESSFDGWLYRITHRVAHRLRRKTSRRMILRTRPKARPTSEVYITDPGGRVDREQAVSLIHGAMEQLPERQREVFDLVDLQGHTPVEAAAMLDMKPVSVRANLFKARASIRRSILLTHPNFAAGAE